MRAKDIFGLLKEAFQDWQEDKALDSRQPCRITQSFPGPVADYRDRRCRCNLWGRGS